ncbi:Rho-type gtpase-activating protein [Gnomoniopsis sp. IMI 355080]|nr:Rho-type gtpase-activating protein [Gnomoniopsis sp. IMI 355080]
MAPEETTADDFTAGNRWHLNCFRCNTCGTLLDSDANLLLLGDGSLICNNCTYSCSACGNKIEDLAILTGDQAFCATCFRCRNCKRKIENLRYARTSQGIFCMNCHESLMARRRKKSKAAAQAKTRDKDSPMVEKSLPALPPSAIPPGAFSDDRVSPDSDTPTELSPRPSRPTYPRKESTSRGSPRPARSPERHQDPTSLPGLGLPPAPNYKNNRRSAMFGGPADLNGPDGDNDFHFIPVALDPSPVPPATSRSNTEPADQRKASNNKDYFARQNTMPETKGDARGSAASTPHIAFQEKVRRTSSEYEGSTPREPSRKASKSSKSDKSVLSQSQVSPVDDKPSRPNGRSDDFKLQDAPKSKKLSNNRSHTHAAGLDEHSSSMAAETPRNDISSSKPASPPRSGSMDSTGSPADATKVRPRDEDKRQVSETAGKSRTGDTETSRPIPRKEVPDSAASRSVNGKSSKKDDLVPPSRPTVEHQMSDTYMSPRAPPPPPAGTRETPKNESPTKTSPALPRYSAGGDFTMDEDMARILGTDEGSSNLLRRVSNAVRHGRTGSTESSALQGRGGHNRSMSETTRATTSPRWPKTPTVTDPNGDAKDISSPISVHSATAEDPAFLRRQLRNSEQRVAELERQFNSEKDLLSLNEKLLEKRKTVSVLDTQTEIMIRQLEVLTENVERAKSSNRPIDPRVLEDTAIKEFVQKLESVQQSMTKNLAQLHAERDKLIEEKNQAIADRDRALLEFEQLSNKNAELAELNNDLTHQIQGRFRSQASSNGKANGLGIYANHQAMSSTSVHNIDASSIQTGATMVGTDIDEPILEGPTVVQVRKGQAKKFNWKKGGKTVAQNITKVGRAVAAFQTNERDPRAGPQPGGLTTGDIGLPYNMTQANMDAPTHVTTLPGQQKGPTNPNDARSFGFFGKKPQQGGLPKSMSTANIVLPTAVVDASTALFGADLVERAEFERRMIPNVVIRCIQEVDIRGMDCEGIYRKSGGSSQVKMLQEGFDKNEDYDISDSSIDIASVTSVLKQYFRKLPNPLLTFEIYDRILECIQIENTEERINHLRDTVNLLPEAHRACLEFLMFHLTRVASREKENFMSPKNLAVVFAPSIMRDLSVEREMTDMAAKSVAVQFLIENSDKIFATE